jgi:hypothetical protein
LLQWWQESTKNSTAMEEEVTAAIPTLRRGEARRVGARRNKARRGEARLSEATKTRLAEARRGARRCQARPGGVRQGQAWPGQDRQSQVRPGKVTFVTFMFRSRANSSPRAENLANTSSKLELRFPCPRALNKTLAEHIRAKRQKTDHTSVILETHPPRI